MGFVYGGAHQAISCVPPLYEHKGSFPYSPNGAPGRLHVQAPRFAFGEPNAVRADGATCPDLFRQVVSKQGEAFWLKIVHKQFNPCQAPVWTPDA